MIYSCNKCKILFKWTFSQITWNGLYFFLNSWQKKISYSLFMFKPQWADGRSDKGLDLRQRITTFRKRDHCIDCGAGRWSVWKWLKPRSKTVSVCVFVCRMKNKRVGEKIRCELSADSHNSWALPLNRNTEAPRRLLSRLPPLLHRTSINI